MRTLLSTLYILLFASSGSAQEAARPEPAAVTDDPALPRVLLIGDSISMAYAAPLRVLLKGRANVHCIPVNGGSAANAVKHLTEWLGTKKWDVIHFNFGLHDLIGEEEYGKSLREIVSKLKTTGARLIWATTTPVPEKDVAAYNTVARKVMDEASVAVDDLHAFAKAQLSFTAKGPEVLAGQVGRSVLSALSAKSLDRLSLKLAQDLLAMRPGLRVLYFGNSRVEGASGLCWSGLQSWAIAKQKLSGTGFSNPARLAEDGSHLLRGGVGQGSPVAKASPEVKNNTWHNHGLALQPGEHITPHGVASSAAIPLAEGLVFTVLYRVGPDEGSFRITPVYRAGADGGVERDAANAKVINANRPGEAAIAAVSITVEPANNAEHTRSIEIEGVEGTSHVFDLHVWSAAPKGLIVGRMGIGGQSLVRQVRTAPGDAPNCRRPDYVEQIKSFDPDVVVMQYGANQGPEGWVNAALEMLGRVKDAKRGRPFLTVLQMENYSPRKDTVEMVERSGRQMVEVLRKTDRVVLLDANGYLPADWPPAGQEQLGKFFTNSVHENAEGSRAVFLALIEALRRSGI